MKELTAGPSRAVIAMAAPIAFGMLFQTLYFFVDCTSSPSWATPRSPRRLGGERHVHHHGLTQVLGVGAVALISQAVAARIGNRQSDLHQSLLLSAVFVS